MLPFRARMSVGEMVIKRYRKFRRALGQELHHQLQFSVIHPGHLLGVESYPSTGMQLVYSTVPADWAL